MPRRSPLQTHRLEAFAERNEFRQRVQEEPCVDDCGVPAGSPCVHADGQPLGRMDHPRRIIRARRRAERARVVSCDEDRCRAAAGKACVGFGALAIFGHRSRVEKAERVGARE